jgi:hypothetical protein
VAERADGSEVVEAPGREGRARSFRAPGRRQGGLPEGLAQRAWQPPRPLNRRLMSRLHHPVPQLLPAALSRALVSRGGQAIPRAGHWIRQAAGWRTHPGCPRVAGPASAWMMRPVAQVAAGPGLGCSPAKPGCGRTSSYRRLPPAATRQRTRRPNAATGRALPFREDRRAQWSACLLARAPD